jgi:archaellum component FlaC
MDYGPIILELTRNLNQIVEFIDELANDLCKLQDQVDGIEGRMNDIKNLKVQVCNLRTDITELERRLDDEKK